MAPAAAKSKAAAGDFRRDATSALRSAAGAVDGLLAASALRDSALLDEHKTEGGGQMREILLSPEAQRVLVLALSAGLLAAGVAAARAMPVPSKASIGAPDTSDTSV